MTWLLVALMVITALFVLFIYFVNKMDKVVMSVDKKKEE